MIYYRIAFIKNEKAIVYNADLVKIMINNSICLFFSCQDSKPLSNVHTRASKNIRLTHADVWIYNEVKSGNKLDT